MSDCRYDREAGEYLTSDGDPCRRDEYGDPTRHCTARRTCSQHVGPGELTCARCLGRTRTDIRQIVERAALTLDEAQAVGVDSEAANLAGPAADYRVFSARRRIDKRWIEDHLPERNQLRAMVNLIADDDEHHPYSVLTRWEFMLREDYGQPRETPTSITAAADYLTRVLSKVAQDDEQDFPLMAREIRKCRTHMENVLRDSQSPERGAPCPDCKADEVFVRLVREYAHWCEDPDCERIHHATEDGDQWVCPRDRSHSWSVEAYRNYVEERKGA